MSALDTRAHLVEHQHYYLSPLPLTGATAQQMDDWINQGVAQAVRASYNHRPDHRLGSRRDRPGYEFERPCIAPGPSRRWNGPSGSWSFTPHPCGPTGRRVRAPTGHGRAATARLNPASRSWPAADHGRSHPAGGDRPGAQDPSRRGFPHGDLRPASPAAAQVRGSGRGRPTGPPR